MALSSTHQISTPCSIDTQWFSRPLIQLGTSVLYLLSAPLTIPLVGCHTNSFRRISSCGEAMARRRKYDRQAGSASRGMCSDGVVSPPVSSHRLVSGRDGVPERCHTSGAAVDAC